ncbi:ATP-binding protein [Chitinophagaceae bacterium LB-8]|uniref:histidine kinase n=1 Tax=Paraflavisolibacter caeni TaxID=2982496 RepID=A0A9X3B951_9BACT|nr:hybrid sensor histidine kinase/response regulator transcription factor [Paraflavisolibacter caeni]MCU7550641.1 ATP-binding protein [Paraflavisolibacter caeni]
MVSGGQHLTAQKLNFEYLTVKNGLAQNTVSSIVKDKYGYMWFGTYNGLCRYDGYKFKVYSTIPGDTNSIANNRIHYIYKDRNGTLWIATFNSSICRYNYQTDNFTRFTPNQLPSSIRDSTNRLRNLLAFQIAAKDLQEHIGAFQLSPTKEHIVFGTKPNNVGGLDDNNVYCVYKDNCGILWLGTATGGVNKLDLNAKPFHSFSVSSDNKTSVNAPIRAILADSSGIWLGTQDNGLVFINSKTKVEKRFMPGPAGESVRSIFKDSYGDIWVGYRTGLDRYDVRSNKLINYYHENTGINSNNYRFLSIAEDPADRSVWFGTFNDVLKYNRKNNTFEKQVLNKYLGKPSAVCLFFDSKNNLWIGTEYLGVIQIKRDPKTHAWTDTVSYNGDGVNPKLPDERVYSITEDRLGNIWIGTANGLCRIDPRSGKVKLYTKQDGLADQYIAKLLPDQQGNIWISHKKGLSKLTVRTGVIRNYAVQESIQGYDFMEGSGCIDKTTGDLYFGNMEGFVSFHPGEIADNPFLPVVVLTEFQVLNKPVGVGQMINGRVVLSAPINMTKKITLTYEDRSFSIEFAALHYSNPEKNQYAYMLEGQDKDWIQTDASRRIASYSNLPAGKYIFKVKASNSDGVWNPAPATLEIIVLPPWWRTWWAYLCYTFLLILAGYLVYRLILARQKYNQQILTERLKAEKVRELDELKSRFFTNVSHEFRTPLTLIIDPLESLLAGKLSTEKVRDYYAIMHRNARRLLGLINQFLDFRKLESGNMPLHITRQDIVAFVRNIMAAFEFQAQQQDINFTFQTDIEALEFGFDADVVDKILYNLLSNAFKFTSVGGRITVSLAAASENPGQVVLSVRDNGVGIPANLIGQIFEPFYQVASKEHNNSGGTGVGLALTKELVTLHKGIITVNSGPNIETCFTVMLSNLADENTGLFQKAGTSGFQMSDSSEEFTPLVQEQETNADPTVVLVVEDNADVRNYLKMNLIADYLVIEAQNGSEGFEKAIETIPDLVISDIMMPGLNGLELCQKLKTDEKTSHIPVILLTARQSDQSQMEGYETGADAYIGKPFSSALLLVRIKNLIESRKKLRQLFNQSTGFNTRLVGTNAADKAFLSKATGMIESNMSNKDLSVEWLASQLFLSRTQLYRKIKALTNQSVHEFVTTIRLNKAAELLLEGQSSVSEIAFIVGYSDSTSFSRMFQKQFGLTPKKFSQQGKSDLF